MPDTRRANRVPRAGAPWSSHGEPVSAGGDRRETALLLEVCRPDRQAERIRRAFGEVPAGHGVVTRAIALDVGPLFFAALREVACLDEFPEQTRATLSRAYYREAAVNARAHARLEEVLAWLSREGIDTVLLKGAALAEPVYGDLAVRHMRDLDLLVPESGLRSTQRILEGHGYVRSEAWHSAEWYETAHHHLVPMHSPDGAVTIEVHRHIVRSTDPISIDVHRLWERTRAVRIGTTDTRSLAPVDLLLHAAVHRTLAGEFVGQMQTLCDIATIVHRFGSDIDWDDLLEWAPGRKAAKYLAYPLRWAAALLHAPVPAAVMTDLGARMAPTGRAHALLDRWGRAVSTWPGAVTSPRRAWLWNDLLVALLGANHASGVGAIVGVLSRGLITSARKTVPRLGVFLPIYAVAIHPFVLVWRWLARRRRR